MNRRNGTQTIRNLLKYLSVAIRVIIFVSFIFAVIYWGYNTYHVFFVKVTPRQAGIFLKEVETLRIEGVTCGGDMPLRLYFVDTPAKLQTINLDNSQISLSTYNPVEIVITEGQKEIANYIVEEPLGFYLSLNAKIVNMETKDNLQRYRVGLCGDGLEYNPIKRTANALYNISRVDLDFEFPETNPEIGISLKDVSSAKVRLGLNSLDLPVSENSDLYIKIRLIHPYEKQPYLFSTNLTISGTGENPTINPGITIGHQINNLQKPADVVSIESNSFTIKNPFGYIEIGGEQFKLGRSTNTVTISAPEYKTIELVSDFYGPSQDYDYAITGKAIQIIVDDENYILSYWQGLSPELQNAYFGLFVAILTGVFGFLFTKWDLFVYAIKRFLFSPLIPKPVAPIPLDRGIEVFYLKSGKRIAGTLVRTEGFFSKQYVLLESREWNGENWGSPINGEVKVSSDSIEMRFKN